MNNSDWLGNPTQDEPEDVIIWSERRVCVDGQKPDNLYDYDLVRIVFSDGVYSDDVPVHKVDWSECPEYQVLHQGAWNTNHGAEPDHLDENTLIRVMLATQNNSDNIGTIREYWWGLSSPSSITYYRVVSEERASDLCAGGEE